ncbi:MAG: isoleucine--tRNA ligase [Verrucomicrobiota bacterium]|nr:isoleucine--tRNA ligase [Verrucomicrobiota bacterium]
MFKCDSSETFPSREEKILRFWQQESLFEKSVENRQGRPLFSFYDGPPFATGLPHYGHILAGTIKDVVARFWTMRGFFVPRRFGWDCHGLPVENEIEKTKELSGASAIEAFGIAQFNEECRSIVLRYTAEWKKSVERMGRWIDFDRGYRTMDPDFMESVWWVFGELYKKGLIYEGFKVMPFSHKLGTPLSNFEANLNYRDVDDPSVVVAFPLRDEQETFFLAWTTTPWTLPSNLALMVGGEISYVKVWDEKSKRHYILAEKRVGAWFLEQIEIEERFLGKALEGKRYVPLFPWFSEQEGAFRVIVEPTVADEEGTGIVHAAPAFGELDFYACKREGIEPVCPVDQNGRFTQEVPPFTGRYVKECDRDIARLLKEQRSLFYQGTIRHRYPFCWRSDTPLIYKVVRTWFVAVEKIKDQLIAANETMHWVPGHIKEGRFGKWLENARDWAISRNRYWGTPIPVWRGDLGDLHVITSVKELEALTGKTVTDLHRHEIDHLTFVKEGQTYRRIPEVFDCWFESGSMPYASLHYPFENRELFSATFPADFIAEGLDQTRGWFYTLTVLASALFDKAAMKHVIVNGLILAEDGTKMSKRLKNYPDPHEVVDRHGADALRLYLLSSPVVEGEDLRFSERGVEEVLRQVLIPLWNSYYFLSTYASIYHWSPEKIEPASSILDRWILSLSERCLQEMQAGMERYELKAAVEPIALFVDQLTNWYIRRSRSRFWADQETPDRNQAFSTLYTVLLQQMKAMAPFIPFLAEAIYQGLRSEKMPLSVHLTDTPVADSSLRDPALEREVEEAQRAVNLGHSLRKEHRVKVRQPLAKALFISSSQELLEVLSRQKELIADELNVKEIAFHSDEASFVHLSAKPHFAILGKKLGKKMGEAQKAITALSRSELQTLLEGKSLPLQLAEEPFLLQPEDVQLERKVREGLVAANNGDLTVVLDLNLTKELESEGLARELINKLNTMRRTLGLHVTDRIAIKLQVAERVQSAFEEHRDYILGEVLGVAVTFESCPEGTAWDLNGEEARIAICQAKR